MRVYVTDKRIPLNQICTLNVEMRDVFMCFASLHEAECTRALNKDSTKSYCNLFLSKYVFVYVCASWFQIALHRSMFYWVLFSGILRSEY